MASDASATPKVLFLQGPPSDFARALGAELMARGARVHRINLCAGDWIYWHGPGTRSYRGSLAGWPDWLDGVLATEGITDLLYFGDCQPYHRTARRVAERRGVRTLAYEYGYLRPDWIVAEPGGQSTYSRLTADPARLRDAARDLPAVDLAPRHRIDRRREARGDVIYHLANYLLAPLYPRFRRDRVFNPILEYLSYLPRHRRARRGGSGAAAGRPACGRGRAGLSGDPADAERLPDPCQFALPRSAPLPAGVGCIFREARAAAGPAGGETASP